MPCLLRTGLPPTDGCTSPNSGHRDKSRLAAHVSLQIARMDSAKTHLQAENLLHFPLTESLEKPKDSALTPESEPRRCYVNWP